MDLSDVKDSEPSHSSGLYKKDEDKTAQRVPKIHEPSVHAFYGIET